MCREQDRSLQERATAQRLFVSCCMVKTCCVCRPKRLITIRQYVTYLCDGVSILIDDTTVTATSGVSKCTTADTLCDHFAVVQYIGQPQSMAYYVLAVEAFLIYPTGAAAQYAKIHFAV
eukprot:3328-Heterococcus_DN1.PRE.1